MTPVWDDRVCWWVAQRIPDCSRGFGKARGLAVVAADGLIAAGVVFHDWNPERGLIELSCAADNPRWFTRSVAREALGYAFSVARMAVARTSERNGAVLRIWRALGSSEHRIPDMWADGEACVVFTLTKAQWACSKLNKGGEHG